jgi:hypothetical protein
VQAVRPALVRRVTEPVGEACFELGDPAADHRRVFTMPDTIELAEGARPAEQPRVRISSPASLLAVIPPLLGFEPSEPSLVVVGTGPPRAEVRITLRLFTAGAHPAIGAGPISIMRFRDVTGIGVIYPGWSANGVSVAQPEEDAVNRALIDCPAHAITVQPESWRL